MATETSGSVGTAVQVDPVTREVINQRLHAIANEMQTVLCRSAFSSIVKESRDASSALFDAEGNTLAQASALPGHLGMLVWAVKRILQVYPPEAMQPGEIYAFNEVYQGGTHLPDITVVEPIFWEGEVVALAVTMSHHQDVGGSAPGSTPPNATEIFAEGLRLPPVRLCINGEINREIWEILSLNTRIPEILQGDLRAQIAVGHIGRRRIEELVSEYGVETTLATFSDLQDYAERLTRHAIEQIPDGDYSYEDYLDHDGVELDRPLKIKVTVSIRGSSFKVDFTGTSEQAKGPLNSVAASTASPVYYVVHALAGPHVPSNQGCYRPIEIVAPQGTLVNPNPPAAVGVRSYTIKRIVDVLFGALAPAAPHLIPAASHGQEAVMYFGGRRPETGEQYVGFIGVPFAGGMGARPTKDGIDVIETDVNNCTNFPLEACEMEHPMRFDYLHLWPDSAGAGRYRGGLGYLARFQWLGSRVVLSHRRDRHDFAPWGIHGGRSAPLCRTIVTRADGRVESLPSKILTYLDEGDVMEVATTGGGGHGDPFERDPQAVLTDVLDGRVSPEAAERDYGVVVDLAGRSVDEAATRRRRSEVPLQVGTADS